MQKAASAVATVDWSGTHPVPAFPPVIMRLLSLLTTENVHLKALAEIVQCDAVFGAEVLRLANSALFGFRGEIASIHHAIAFLGTERVKGLVLTVAMRQQFRSVTVYPCFHRCWRHSLASAIVSEHIARVAMLDPGQAYTAGLLHDLGRIALVVNDPEGYAQLLRSCEDPALLLERERDKYGVDHCEVGASLARTWKLPAQFELILGRHHGAGAGVGLDLPAVVQHACPLADAVGFSVLDLADPAPLTAALTRLPYWEDLRLKDRQPELALEVASRVNTVEMLYG